MSVLGGQQIRMSIESGSIICHPFAPERITHTSLEVTLGHYYYRIEKTNSRTIYNPFDPEDVERLFEGPYTAMPHAQWCRLNGLLPVKNISAEHPVISLKPGERILAHTHEFVGIHSNGTYEVRPRAEWSGNGISVAAASQSTTNRITISIHNTHERETVLLPVGEAIAELVFEETGESSSQPAQDLDTVIKTWSPDMLIPKAYTRQRRLPPKIEGMQYE